MNLIPCAGQGIIAIQCKDNDVEIKKLLEKINDNHSRIRANTEREVLKTLEGDCDTAVGAFSNIDGNNISLSAELFSVDGKHRYFIKDTKDINLAKELGREVGEALKSQSKGVIKDKMHILLTRPLDDCKELILRFKSLGHKVSHLPVIKIQNVQYYDKVNINEFSGIIFTSANAIKNLNTSDINKKLIVFVLDLQQRK